jgi:hypothetical protein
MLGSLRFAFSLFPFLLFLWDKPLVSMVVALRKIGVSVWHKWRLVFSVSPAPRGIAVFGGWGGLGKSRQRAAGVEMAGIEIYLPVL